MNDCGPLDSPMNPNKRLMENQGEPLSMMLSRQDLIDRSSITRYFIVIGGNIISGKSKKQNVVV